MCTTSHGEASHSHLKKDLGTSVADHLYIIQSFERTITHQHELCKKALENEQVTKSTRLLHFSLYGDVHTWISQYALQKVAAIYDAYLPRQQNTDNHKLHNQKKVISEHCTGLTLCTQGIPCIHVIKRYVDQQRSLKTEDFHQQWHLYTPETMPVPNPCEMILEPCVVDSVQGSPSGMSNQPTPTSTPASTNPITGTE